MQVEGIPEGWELVRVGRPTIGEYIVSYKGQPTEIDDEYCGLDAVIIRKIEKLKRYRAFKDTVEYMPYYGRPIRRKGGRGFDAIISATYFTLFVAIGDQTLEVDLQTAFDSWEFVDGTPFGVEVVE